MPDPQWPRPARTAWLAGVVLGYLLAAIAMLNPPGAPILGAIALVAPTMALLAYPHRPGLLLPAGAIAIVSLYMMSLYGLPMVLVGLVWLWVHHQVAGSKPSGATGALVVGVVLWLAVPAVTTVHLDPTCVQTLRDGTVQAVNPATRGYPTGWVWQIDSTVATGTMTAQLDTIADSCVSNSVVGWETAAAITMAVAAVFLCWLLTKPTEATVETRSEALV
ncbi:MAG: hypothetical protein WD895_08755 [Acidimicrobiia bacterium]